MRLSSTEKRTIIEICRRHDISYCAVFGSFARGDARTDSDLDLLVTLTRPMGFEFSGLALELEDALGRKVDLATDAMIGPYIRENVMRDLVTIYEDTERLASAPAYS